MVLKYFTFKRQYHRKNIYVVLPFYGKIEQIYHALCINYTAAFCCDLMTDYIEVIKQKEYSHSAQGKNNLHDEHSYTEWTNYVYEHIIVKETAPDYLDIFDKDNLMKHLRKEESFRYRHRTVPNAAGT